MSPPSTARENDQQLRPHRKQMDIHAFAHLDFFETYLYLYLFVLISLCNIQNKISECLSQKQFN